jgi:hypothetical protein
MSSPQEKAKELFNKFAFEKTPEGYKMFQTLDESKRCALIAVNEILRVAYYANDDIYNLYLEVKTEIEKI